MQFLKRKTLLSPQIFNIAENSDASRQIGYYSLINSLTRSCIHLFKAFIKAVGHVIAVMAGKIHVLIYLFLQKAYLNIQTII